MKSIASKSQKKALLALRLLALTAPGGRASLIEATRLLQDIVPNDNTMILWQDGQCNTIDVYQLVDAPLFLVQDYLENFMHTLGPDGEEGAGFTMRQVQTSGLRVVNATDYRDHNTFLKSLFYNRFLRYLNADWTVAMPLRNVDGTPIASFNLGRIVQSRDFTLTDLDLMDQVQPWLEHLARKESLLGIDSSRFSSGESASLLIDAAGKLLSASPFALVLLHQAADAPMSDRISRRQTVQGDVSILLRRFSNSITSAMNAFSSLPPSLYINNRWGRFHILAYVLNPFESGVPMQISLHIERQVPLSLGLFRLRNFLNLSPREREVCLHILAGLTHTEIAVQMRVKPSTIIYFTRQLYQRLNINRQAELLPALMADEG